jgi:hypothetical protein
MLKLVVRKKKIAETVADFKARIARMMRERGTGIKYSLIGASPAPSFLVRKPTDEGYKWKH